MSMIDLAEVNTATMQPTETLERGWYGARIIHVERKPYSDQRKLDPNNENSELAGMLLVKVALDEPYDAYRAKENFHIWHPVADTRKHAKKALSKLAKCVGLPPQFELEDLKRKQINVLIEPSTWTNSNNEEITNYEMRAYQPHESASNSSSQSEQTSARTSPPTTETTWF